MGEGHRRHLRNYLLDRKYQLRYTVIMVVISSVLTGALGYFWYDQMRETSKTVEVKALATMSEAEVAQIQAEMRQGDQLRLLVLVGFGVLLAVALTAFGIVLTHKVAGPLFKIGRYMAEVRDGRLGPIYELRRGDQLHEFYNGFKEMHAALRRQTEEDVATLGAVIEATEHQASQVRQEGKKLDLDEPLQALRDLRDRKTASLQG